MFNATKITTAALALALLAPAAAMAETMSVPVRYGDLDLSTPQGQRSLERRIAAASRMICGSVDRERDLGRRSSILKCLAEVRQSAEPAKLAAIAQKNRAVS